MVNATRNQKPGATAKDYRKGEFKGGFAHRDALFALGALGAVVVIGWLSLKPLPQPDPAQMPGIGTTVDSAVGGWIPDGGRVLIVSDLCELCQLRANSYRRYIATSEDVVLVVQEYGDSVLSAEGQGADYARGGHCVSVAPRLSIACRRSIYPELSGSWSARHGGILGSPQRRET